MYLDPPMYCTSIQGLMVPISWYMGYLKRELGGAGTYPNHEFVPLSSAKASTRSFFLGLSTKPESNLPGPQKYVK